MAHCADTLLATASLKKQSRSCSFVRMSNEGEGEEEEVCSFIVRFTLWACKCMNNVNVMNCLKLCEHGIVVRTVVARR